MTSKRVTMREIARMAGTSAVTVSKAIAGRSGVGQELREKILTIAKETGYTLPRQESGTSVKHLDIGIVIPERYFGPESYYAVMCKQLMKRLAEQGHFGALEILTSENEQDLVLPHLVQEDHVNGLILLGEPCKSYYRMLAQGTIPVVYMDFYDEQGNADSVVGDNTYGTYRLTSHLIRNNHQRIDFVGSLKTTSSIMDRFLGYHRAMMMHDLQVTSESIIYDRDPDGNMIPLVLPENMPTAFVCNCDMVARDLITLLQSKGYRVPEDISVTGFDDFLVGPPTKPQISTYRLNTEAMIDITVKKIIERCQGTESPFTRSVVAGQPIYRESECENHA